MVTMRSVTQWQGGKSEGEGGKTALGKVSHARTASKRRDSERDYECEGFFT